MQKGVFITFEGIDGCGKTTQLSRLGERLRSNGREVVETVEPGGTGIGRDIRRILLDRSSHRIVPRTELLLYFASRAQNCAEVIEPALTRGSIVLCDRFADSTIVYQGAGQGIPQETIRSLDRIACNGLRPDVTVLLDIDVEESLRRARARNAQSCSEETRFDDKDRSFFERVREGYLELERAEPSRIFRVDGRGDVEDVADRVWKEVSRFV